jgi:hypothetical protein
MKEYILRNKVKLLIITLSLLLIICALAIWLIPNPTLIGGELYALDFKNGFDLYIEEGYSMKRKSNFCEYEIEPHSVWFATDENVKDSVYRICAEIEQYREYDPASDLMLGSPPFIQNLPRILLDTHSVGYMIQILNWDNYSGDAWAGFPIKNELYGNPVLLVSRCDLSSKADDESFLRFMDTNGEHYWSNTEWGFGWWYSIISQERLDDLLVLLNSIDSNNAEQRKLV